MRLQASPLKPCSPSYNGRGGEIRTHDLYVPNVALYQAKLRPDPIEPSKMSARPPRIKENLAAAFCAGLLNMGETPM